MFHLPSHLCFLTSLCGSATLAFAGDVILCGTTSWGLHRNLEIFEEELRRSGLSLNPGKSKCVSLVASEKEKKVKLVMTPTFRASGSWLNQVDGTTLWKYLGLKFRGCGMAGCGSDDVAECLERLTRAPLKPQQRMHLLRVFLLPRFYHVWTFGRLNATSGHPCSECHPDMAAPTPRRTGGILSRAD
jgi:hypothetical protein